MTTRRIDELPTTILPTLEHVLPAVRENQTVQLSLTQISDLIIGLLNNRQFEYFDLETSTNLRLAEQDALNIRLTGDNQINSLGAAPAGIIKRVVFAGSPLINDNAVLIMPAQINLQAQPGDSALFISEGATTWRCLYYTKSDGTPIAYEFATNASAFGRC